MIVCFECPEDRKREMDELIKLGKYRDYSELISLAIANQYLLHSRTGIAAGIVVERELRSRSEQQEESTAPGPAKTAGQSLIPAIFQRPNATGIDVPTAAFPEDVFVRGESVPLERWIFGQFNRLLPAKASCRAIANMLLAAETGIDLSTAALEIAREARSLANELHRRDLSLSIDRDDLLSTAFPVTSGAEKGIARYSSQFVGAMNNQGQLTGLLASLKLIGRRNGKKSVIALTEAGWAFAQLRSPCLDSIEEDAREKFSNEERDSICRLIRDRVPQEASAYETILQLIVEGRQTPEQLDTALEKYVSPNFNASKSFIATQRSGAISRMTDLRLVGRAREGVRVRYVITERGNQFCEKVLP